MGLGVGPFTVGQTVLKVASNKVAKHEKPCSDNQHAFIPFAFDTFGFLAPEVVDFLHRVQKVTHSNVMSPRSMNVVFTRIDFAIKILNFTFKFEIFGLKDSSLIKFREMLLIAKQIHAKALRLCCWLLLQMKRTFLFFIQPPVLSSNEDIRVLLLRETFRDVLFTTNSSTIKFRSNTTFNLFSFTGFSS